MLELLCALGICMLLMIPRLTPKNAFGMVLDGLPVKSLFHTKLLAYFIFLTALSLAAQRPDFGGLVWLWSCAIFVTLALISGWAPYYSGVSFLVNMLFTGGLLLIGHHVYLIGVLVSLVIAAVSRALYKAERTRLWEKHRYERWVRHRVRSYQRRYKKVLPKKPPLNLIVLSLLFIEDVSRPWFVRIFEHLVHRMRGGSMTTGLMQVDAVKNLSDTESVVLGTAMAKDLLRKHPINPAAGAEGFRDFARAWNSHEDYRFLLQIVYAIIAV